MFSPNSQAKTKISPKEAVTLGLYVHVPFCASTCDFCAFYQKAGSRQELLRYLEGMDAEFVRWRAPLDFETIFWGGGTPGLLPAGDLARLADLCRRACLTPPREWSMEWAPSTVKADKVRVCGEAGISRASLGVQSFSERALEALGRRHSPRQVDKAIDLLRANGATNLNLDLMFAAPGQEMKEWEADLRAAIDRQPEHISTYCLTFEEDTVLYLKLAQGKVTRSEEREREFYLRTWEILEDAGYRQYEVSNFARPGYECLHNVRTWEMNDWLGWGPSAASQFRGRRFSASPDLEQWLKSVQDSPWIFDEVNLGDALSTAEKQVDRLVFGLRMTVGVSTSEWPSGLPSMDVLKNRLYQEGYLEETGGCLRLTVEGRLRADAIGSAIIEAMDI